MSEKVVEITPAPTILSILEMDGRKRAPRVSILNPRQSQYNPSVSSVRSTIKEFERMGQTSHSGRGMLLPYVIAYCEAKGYSYQLTAHVADGRKVGYQIVKLSNLF